MVSRQTQAQFIRFFVVGAISFLVDTGILFFLKEFLKFDLVLFGLISGANVISVMCGMVTSFMLNRHWAFKAGEQKVMSQGGRFLVVFIVTYIGNQIVFGWFTNVLAIHYLISKVLVTLLQMVTSFLMYKFYVFKK